MFISGSINYGLRNIVNTFSSYHDVQIALPPPMKGEHLAHATYAYGNTKSAVDVYSVDKVLATHLKHKPPRQIDQIHFNGDSSRDAEIRAELIRKHNIQFVMQKGLQGTKLEDEIIMTVLKDVQQYDKGAAKVTAYNEISETIINYVDEIIIETTTEYTDPKHQKHILQSGKGDFLLNCKIDGNVDANEGCITGWMPGTFSNFTPSWDKDTEIYKGFVSDKFQECAYCYKIYGHELFPKKMRDIAGRMDQLEYECTTGDFPDYNGKILGHKVNLLRGGKTTEIASLYTLKHLMAIMEVSVKTKTNFVFPGKYMDFQPELLEYLKSPYIHFLSSVSSIGHLELGANRSGHNLQQRLDVARQYREHGANVSLFHMIDYVYGMNSIDDKIQLFAEKHNIPVIKLQMTIMNKNLAKPMTGRSWKEIIQPYGQHNLDGNMIGGYVRKGAAERKKSNTGLIPGVFKDDIINMLGDNTNPVLGGCAHIEGAGGKSYCAGCGHYKGNIVQTEKPKGSLDLESYIGLNMTEALDKYNDDTKDRVKKKKTRKKGHKQPNKLFTKQDYLIGLSNEDEIVREMST